MIFVFSAGYPFLYSSALQMANYDYNVSTMLEIIERGRGRGSLHDLQEQLKKAIQNGEWRTVIMSLDPNGNINRIGFPVDDLILRDQHDMAACELVSLFEIPGEQNRILFGHLRVHEGHLFVTSASDERSKPVDEKAFTQKLQQYFQM
jgi:hypothetical protein